MDLMDGELKRKSNGNPILGGRPVGLKGFEFSEWKLWKPERLHCHSMKNRDLRVPARPAACLPVRAVVCYAVLCLSHLIAGRESRWFSGGFGGFRRRSLS